MRTLSRNRHLSIAVIALLTLVLVSCAPATPAPAAQPAAPQATEAPKPVEPTKAPAAELTKAPAAAPTKAPEPAAAALPKAQGKFVYWGGLIFSDEANKMLTERIKQWGKERGVDVEVVMINQNETVQKVSAAIEAGNMPDAFDIGRDFLILLSRGNRLEPIDDLYAKVGKAHGGWLDSANKASDPKLYGGKLYGVPFGTSGNLINRRDDLLSAAGFKDAPQTWEELAKQAEAAQKPPKVYGMGFALSNVGDANMTNDMLRSYGGRIADDEGKKCTLDSPETRAFLKWITEAYAKGLFPPGVSTWDGAGDNTAYQAGQAIFIGNPGSVYLNLVKNDPELAKASKYSAFPKGPKMQIGPQGPNYRAISASSKNKELAKDLFEYLADDKFVSDYFGQAIYGPVLKNQTSAPIYKSSPLHAGLLDLALNGTPPDYPDVSGPALAEYNTNYLTPKMVLKVVVDKKSIDDAIKETQAACQAIYDKNNK
jgi:multiple sugar transport system substrate-binding protein